MAAALLGKKPARPYAYSKMEAEDREELVHRRAQFLIYKAMHQIEKRGKPSRMRVRITKLRIKIGRRLRKLRKRLLASVGAARACVARQLKQLACCDKIRPDLPRMMVLV